MFQQTPLTRVLFRGTQRLLWMCVFVATLLLSNTFFDNQKPAEAATSSNLNYQARLLSANGNVVPDGFYNLQFKLYSAASGGTALWTETYYDANGATAGQDNRVRVVNGYISVNLASQTAFPTNMNWDQDLWITMNVGGAAQTATPGWDGEMSPRIKLTAVPYAFQAQRAEQLSKTVGSSVANLLFPSTLGQNTDYNFVDPGIASVDICLSTGNCAGAGGGVTTAGGNAGEISFFNGSSTIQGSSSFTWNNTTQTLSVSGGNSGSTNALEVYAGIGGARSLTFDRSNGLSLQSGTTSGLPVFRVGSNGNDNKLVISSDGTLQWGDGGGGTDVSLTRSGVGTVKITGSLEVTGSIINNSFSPRTGLTYTFNTADPDGTYQICTASGNCAGAGGGVTTPGGTAGQIAFFSGAQSIQGSNSLFWDTTNGQLGVGTNTTSALLTIGTNTTTAAGGIKFGTDTTLYRSAAGGLKTDGFLTVSQDIYAGNNNVNLMTAANGTAGKYGFRLGGDTYLYRDGPGYLRTDGHLLVGTNLDLWSQSNIPEIGGSGNAQLRLNTFSTGNVVIGAGNTSSNLVVNNNANVNKNLTVNGTALFKNSTDSATAFQIQNADATNNLFVADTLNGKVGIGQAPSSSGTTLQVNGTITTTGINLPTGSITVPNGNVSAGANFILSGSNPAVNGNLQKVWTVGTTGVNSGDVVVLDPVTGRVITTTTERDPRVVGIAVNNQSNGQSVGVAISGTVTVNVTAGTVNIGDQLVASGTSGLAKVDNNATTGIIGYALSTPSGSTVRVNLAIRNGQSTPRFQNVTNSTTAFQIQNAAGTSNLFNADTTNNRIGIGTNAPQYTLDVVGDIGFSGTLYGNSFSPQAGVTYSFATAAAGAYNICTTAGNCSGVGGGVTTPGGTANRVAKFTASGTIADSLISDDGSVVKIQNAAQSNNLFVVDTTTGKIAVGQATATATLDVNGSINSTVGIYTGASGGTQRLDASGNLVNINSLYGINGSPLTIGGTGIGSGVIFQNTNSSPGFSFKNASGGTVLNISPNNSTTCVNCTTSSSSNFTVKTAGGLANALQLRDGSDVAFTSISNTGAALFQNTADSTTAFQVQNAAGNSNLLVADTTNSKIGIGLAPSSTGATLQVAGNASITGGLPSGAALTISPNSTSYGISVSSTSSLPAINVYNVSSTIGVQSHSVNGTAIRGMSAVGSAALFEQTGSTSANTGTAVVRIIRDRGGTGNVTGDLLYVQDNASTTGTISGNLINLVKGTGSVFSVGNTGNVTSKNSIDSTSAFQIQSAGGATYFNVDTSGGNIAIGSATGGNTNTSIRGNLSVRPLNNSLYAFQVQNAAGISKIAYDSLNDQLNITTNSSIFKNATNSTAAFQVQNAAGSSAFRVDTTNFKVNSSKLGVYSDAADAFSISNATGSSVLFRADTNNNRIGIGANASSPSYTLDIGGDIGYTGTLYGNLFSPQAGVTYTFATATAGAYDICTTAGNCAGVGGGITGSGTANRVARFSTSGNIVDSLISDDGATVKIQNAAQNNNLFVADTENGRIGIGKVPTQGALDVSGDIYAVGNVQATSGFVINNANASSGAIRRMYTAGGAISANDVVSLNTSGATVISSATPRDRAVYGVATHSQVAGGGISIAVGGHTTVNADAAAVAIGDQLVTTGTAGVVTVNNNATTGIIGYATTSKGAGAGTVGVMVRPVGGQYSPVFRNDSDSANAFVVQNAGGTAQLTVDTTNSRVTVNNLIVSGAIQVPTIQVSNSLQFYFANTNSGNIQKATTTTTAVNAGDVVIMTSNSSAINNPLTVGQTTTPRDPKVYGIAMSTVASGAATFVAISGQTAINVDTSAVAIGDQLVTSGTAGLATVDNNATTGIIGRALSTKTAGANGQVAISIQVESGQYTPTFRNATNSTSAFNIQNAAGTNVISVNTVDGRLGINSSPTYGVLSVAEAGITTEAFQTGGMGRSITLQGAGSAYFIGRDVTNDVEYAFGTSTAQEVFAGSMTNHDFTLRTNNTARINITAAGRVGIGTGTSAVASLLQLGSDAGTGTSGITFGSTGDTNLYRSAADILRTDDTFMANTVLAVDAIQAQTGNANQVTLGRTASGVGGPGITFGSAADTNLYRSGASQLQTDGRFIAAGANSVIGSASGSANQVYLSTTASGVVGAGITFGSAADTNIYRSAADTLKTDDKFVVGGALNVDGTANSYIMGPLGLGTANPQAASAMTIGNSKWISAIDALGTGYINMFKVNANNEIQVGAALNVQGGITLPTDGGQMVLVDMPFSSGVTAGTPNSYTFGIGQSNALTVYAENDGSGNAQNIRVAIGSSITPQFTLDVAGDINTTGAFRINGVAIATGPGNYIQNGTTQQIANFNIVSSNASAVAAVIQGAASGTADLFQVKDGTGTNRLSVTSAGVVNASNGLSVTGTAFATELRASNQVLTPRVTRIMSVASGTINQYEPVVAASATSVSTSSTPRDPRVVGVSIQTGSSTVQVIMDGDYPVQVDASAVAIGDQLVISSTPGFATVDNNATTGIIGIAMATKAAGSTGTVNTLVRPRTGGPISPNFRSDSANAFLVQNAAGSSTVLNADTTGSGTVYVSQLKIGDAAIITGTSGSGGVLSTGSSIRSGNSLVARNGGGGEQVNVGTVSTGKGGVIIGGDTNLYRESANVLKTDGNLIVGTGLQAGSLALTAAQTGLQMFSARADNGYISHGAYISGTVVTGDLVVLTGVNGTNQQVATTTTPRDPRVYGIAQSGVTNSTANVVTSGNFNVNVDSGAVAIGDQLVTSTTAGKATVDNTATTGIIGTALGAKAAGADGNVPVAIRQVGGQANPYLRFNNDTSLYRSAAGTLKTDGNFVADGSLNINGTGNSYIMGALGLGTVSPQTGSALTLANSKWISALDASGTGYINMFQVNANNEIQVGAALNVQGGIILPTDGGQMTFSDLPFSSTAVAGMKNSYTLRVGSTNALTVYGEANGSGGTQNVRVAVGSNINPAYTLDVGGDVNVTGSFRVNGVALSTASGGDAYLANTQTFTGQNTFRLDSATAFQIQSSGGTNLFAADTSASQVKVGGGISGSTAQLQVAGAIDVGSAKINVPGGSGYTTIGNVGGNPGINFFNSSGNGRNSIYKTSSTGALAFCAGTTNACASDQIALTTAGSAIFTNSSNSASGFLIRNSAGTNIFEVDTSNQTIGIGVAGGNTAKLSVQSAMTNLKLNQVSVSNIIDLQNNGTSVALVGATGNTLFKNSSDSATAFQIQRSNGDQLFTVDTTNSRVGVGTGTPAFRLDVRSNINGADGIVMQNANTGSSASGSMGLFNNAGLYGGITLNSSSNTSRGGVNSLNLFTGAGGGKLALGTNDTIHAIMDTNGAMTFKNSTNSMSAFQIQNTAANNLFSADTTNNQISIIGGNGDPYSSQGALHVRSIGTTLQSNSNRSTTINHDALLMGTPFTASASDHAVTIKLRMKKNSAIDTYMAACILPDSGGTPDLGAEFTCAEIPTSTLPTEFSDIYVDMRPSRELTTGQQYWFLLLDMEGEATGNISYEAGGSMTVARSADAISYTNSTGVFPYYQILSGPYNPGIHVKNAGGTSVGIEITSEGGRGIYARNYDGDAIFAQTEGAGNSAVYGNASGLATGIKGISSSGSGVHGDSYDGIGVQATSTNGTGLQASSQDGISALFQSSNTSGTYQSTVVVKSNTNQTGALLFVEDYANSGGTFTISSDASTKIKTDNGDAFLVQNSSGQNLLQANTAGMTLIFGSASPTLSNYEVAMANTEIQGTLRVGTATDGFSYNDAGTGAVNKLRLYGTARNTKKIVLTPEYAGSVLDGTGVGTMTAGYDSTRRENYYKWTTTQTSAQTYSVVLTMAIPSDWSEWAPSNALSVNSWSSNTSNSTGSITVLDTAGIADLNAVSITPGSNSTWTTTNVSLSPLRFYSADGMITIKFNMTSNNNSVFQLGNLNLTYLSQY